MLRERKIVLFVMGDEEILERSRMVVSQLALEYSVKIVRNYSAAYKIIVEHQDLFTDYEVVKGGMDDVFLAVTGKRLGGEH